MNVAVLVRIAWSHLGPDVLAYRRVTDPAGLPTPRARRTLFTRIFDPPTKYALENSASIADPAVIAAVEAQVASAAERLGRTVGWHRALRDAYYRLPREDQFLSDPVERLFAPAWDQALHEVPPRAEAAAAAADEVIAGLRETAGPLTSASLARSLDDAQVVAAVQARVDEVWAARIRPEQPEREVASALRSAAVQLAATIVPSAGVVDSAADVHWNALRSNAATGALLAQHTYGLSNHSEPTAPPVVSAAWAEPSAGQGFAALDASLQSRLQRILAGDRRGEQAGFPADLTARAALDRAAGLVAHPLSLGSTAAHAVFYLASIAYVGVGTERGHSGIELPRGAVRYLASHFRKSQGVSAVLEWQYGGFGSAAADFVADPLPYAFGRLWIRLSRTDFDQRTPSSPADAWAHLRGAIVSSGEHVRELSKRIVSRHAPTRSLHDLLDTEHEPAAASAELTDRTDDSADIRAGLGWVVQHALRTDGQAAVEDFFSTLAGDARGGLTEPELRRRWEHWATGTAHARARSSAGRSTPEEQIASLPAYAQIRERLARGTSRPDGGIGTHPVGSAEQGGERS